MSLALSERQAAKLFEELRADLPCVASAKGIAARYRFAPTDYSENEQGYQAIEFKKRGSDVYVLVSYEKEGRRSQNALSLSAYGTDSDYPANLTNAFADIWNLPAPKPLRTDPTVAAFSWKLKFPNGRMEIVISNNPDTGLTQIYGRTLDLTKDQASGCSF